MLSIMAPTESLSFALATRTEATVWAETIVFAFMNVLAFFGNLLTCYAVYRNHRLRTLPNMFVIALAVSDILLSTCCSPFTVVTLFRGQWVLGETFCEFFAFGVFIFGMASLNTMGIIAISRYFRIVKSNKYIVLFKKNRTLMYIATVWFIALLGSVPPLFFDKESGFEFQPGKAMCAYSFESNIPFTSFTELYIGTPFIIISVCYVKVFCAVSRANRVFSHQNNFQQIRANVEEAKVTNTLAAVMVGFSCCWLPVCVIDITDAVHGKKILPRQIYLTYTSLIFLSSTINPFIYGVTNRRFRREYTAILSKIITPFRNGDN